MIHCYYCQKPLVYKGAKVKDNTIITELKCSNLICNSLIVCYLDNNQIKVCEKCGCDFEGHKGCF